MMSDAALTRPTFSIEPAGDYTDVSNFALMYPEIGPAMPATFTVSSVIVPELPDIAAWLEQRLSELRDSDETVVIEHSSSSSRDNWHYAIIVLQRGPEDFRQSQKMMQLYVDGDPITEYTMIGTSLHAVFAQAERLFDSMIRSFKPSS